MRVFFIIWMALLPMACDTEKTSDTGEEDNSDRVQEKEDPALVEHDLDYDFSISKQVELVIDTSTRQSFRGMHVLSPNVAWVSGMNGVVGITRNAGEDWELNRVPGCESCDFRDIVALNDSTALVVSIASPGYIYKTSSFGKDWELVYENKDSLVFMDAIEFWDNQNGLVFGDPVDDKVFLLKTVDGGDSWSRVDHIAIPKSMGTAGFAASGTSIALGDDGKAWIGLGGDHSFVLKSEDYGIQWKVYETPMPQGLPGRGIYSLAFLNDQIGVAVGGNWEKELSDSCAAYTNDGGITWTLIEDESPNGYRSCVAVGGESCEALSPFFVTCGTSGVDLSLDNGQIWERVDSTNLNVIEFAPNTGLGWGADSWGNVYRVEVKHGIK